MTYTLYAGAAVVALYILEPLLVEWLYLQSQRFNLFLQTFLFKIKMELDLYLIRYQGKKYERMAKEILKDIQRDEAK